MKLYCIFDRVVGEYGEPFVSPKEALAVRRFNYVMQNAPMVSQDCQLYCLGEYNTESGVIVPNDRPLFVCNFGGVKDE